MPWVEEYPDYDYRFLSSGELEFRGRGGRYFLTSGCSAAGWFEFADRVTEAAQLCQDAPDGVTVEALYLQQGRFRHVCDRILELNSIDPDWVTPHMLAWLLFGREENGQIIPAPLQTLNQLPEPRYPKPKGNKKDQRPFDRVALLSALASHCGGDLGKALEVAQSGSARELLAVMDQIAWQSKTPEQRHKAKLRAWADKEREKARTERESMMADILKSRGVKRDG
ncbi:MAG: hypothetical protein AAFN18_12065 [Cyanobacteria bacterium J06554_6]